jgi:hypothetical protein
MTVMEQGDEIVLLFECQHAVDQIGIIPLVQDHNIGFSQFLLEKMLELSVRRLVKANVQLGIGSPEAIDGLNRALALMLHQVRQRPTSQLLVAPDPVTHPSQLASQAAQEVGVAVVPVGDQGMGKERDVEFLFHAAATAAGAKVR